MYDLAHVRRLTMAVILALAGVTGLILLYPHWTIPPPVARPLAPRVVFRLHDQRTPAESAVVWSPALIALAGPVSRRSPADRVGGLTPPLSITEFRPLGIVRQARATDETEEESRWPWIWQLFGPPAFRAVIPSPAGAAPELAGGGLHLELPPDAPALDVSAAPLPAEFDREFRAALHLSFDWDGRAAAVLLERPADDPAINARLVRDAYRWRIPAGRAADFRVNVAWRPPEPE